MKLASKRMIIVLPTVCLSLLAVSCVGVRGTSMSLIPSSEEVKPGEQFEIEVQVEPGKQGISAIEISLSFDSQAMQVIQVKPGMLLGERPLSGISNIDNEVGTLSYSLSRIGETKAPTPTASFAVIVFQILDRAQGGDYELSFAGVGLANENFEDILEITLKGASIKVKP
jgi:hypothetical protein